MGVQFRRTIRDRNEWAFLTPLPISVGARGLVRISTTPTLVGLEVPPGSRNLEIKPYITSGLTTDRVVRPALNNNVSGDVGLDVKYGLTQNLTLDFTLNTDLAQVEADDQQVNLTRFNLSFPEKREFFLEGRGIFDFGSGPGSNLFYSRRIGLLQGRAVPIIAGTHLTSRVGRLSIGALNVQTGGETVSGARDTNFTVVRLRQNVLRRSNIGVLFTNRSSSLVKPGEASPAYGIDGSFAFYENVTMAASYAKSGSPGTAGPNDSYEAMVDYGPTSSGSQRGTCTWQTASIPRSASSDATTCARASRRSASARALPRCRTSSVFRSRSARRYTENTAGILETRDHTAQFQTAFNNTDQVSIQATNADDVLLQPFRITSDVTIPAGSYSVNAIRLSYTLGRPRTVSGSINFDHGGFYEGDSTTIGYSGRVSITPRLGLEPNASVRWIDTPFGSFTTQQYRARLTYTFTPLMLVAGLVQYNTNSHRLGINLRLRWEYSPAANCSLSTPRTTTPTRASASPLAS